MRTRWFLPLVLAAPLAVAGPVAAASAAATSDVSILMTSFSSPQTDVLAGDTVTWHNSSFRTHTVTAADGGWGSSRLPAQATFSHRFDAPGVVGYYCQLHPFMRGEVDVHRVLLSAPRGVLAPGRPYVLTGRADLPAGSAVSIEAGGGTPAATASVDASGGFRAKVAPRTTTSYRAVAGGDASPPVRVRVLDRRVVDVRSARGVVTARVRPASPGATVVLQLRLRDRFGWWPVKRARLDRSSRARFVVRPGRRVRARVVLTLRDGATALASSRTIAVAAR